ncbi:nucleoporin subcomplex protein binding to Pom34-domain-containing protein [Mycotypha africana]|uniref:nucleoporin subcomplex protein binding to Pom34-domain-containing protein n=1 Tax=Mycotypha africana TaxID=64632 RepID=UPI0023019E6C|nr:nucleoporin subcomplex protein binding to Pom34-domain-containing protein [Mycotypha africana]KAI8988270.1 nucleoporin subcomplex protein binding to Pom34-domain-containing protein [Mycotypha africana]
MVQTDQKEKFARTYRELFDTIERGADQCSTDRLQTLLEERQEQLKSGLDAFGSTSAQSRSKVNSGTNVTVDGKTIKLDQSEKEFVLKLSELIDLNELQCASLWDNYRTFNKEVIARLTHADDDQKTVALHENIQLLLNVINLHYEDRIALLECIASLKRIAMNGGHLYTTIADNFITKLYTNQTTGAFIERLFAQYVKLVRTNVPHQMYSYPGWALVWAKQNLREQKALLEIIFLFTVVEPVSPDFTFTVIQEFEADSFASHQAFGYILDDEGIALRDKVMNLCILLSISTVISPTLTTEIQLDSAKAGQTLIDSPGIISKINQIAVYLGDKTEHSVFLLAWSFLLTCVNAVKDAESTLPADYKEVEDILAGKQAITTNYLLDRPPVSRSDVERTKRVISIQQLSNMDRIYIGRSLKLGVFNVISQILSSETCSEEDVNNFGYRTVIQRLLKSFLSFMRPHFIPTESYEDLISSYCLLYKNQPALCNTFWNEYFDESNPFSLLATARGRFPVLFADFIRLLSALSGAPDEELTQFSDISARRVFNYVCNIPTLTVQLKSSTNLRENTDDAENTIYSNQPIRVTYESDLIGGLVIPQNCAGKLLNNSDDEPIVQFIYSYSGWHLLTSVLSAFVTEYKHNVIDIEDDNNFMSGKDIDVINSILSLIYNVLLSDSSLVSELTQHIDKVTGNTNNATPTLISILCNTLTFCSGFDKCPITTMTLTLKCLTLLVPSYSDFIWAYLKFAPLLPTTNISYPVQYITANATTSAQIQGIVSRYECTIGRYSLLLSFLDFVQKLVTDIQHKWWISENMQNNLASNSQYKVEILYICLHYLMSDVFPSYAHWRYQKISERFLIGTKILSIFTDIATNFKDTTTTDSKLSLSSIRENIFNNFLYEGGVYHVSPLIDTISDGAKTANTLYKSDHPKEAQRIEKLTEITFNFVKILLQYRLEQIQSGQTIAESTLERLLLERTSGKSSSDFLLRVARHIHYRHNISLPIQATNVLSILCRTTATWKTSPNFVQYLGSTEQVHSIIRTYLEIAKDPSQNSVLLASIWQLLTVLLETQPSLAILFLDCGDLIMPSPKSAVKLLSGDVQSSAAPSNATTDSAIRAAVDILSHWELLSVEKPAVMSNALRFLATFWKTAFDHYVLVERNRADNALWDALGKILLSPTSDIDITGKHIASQDLLQKDNADRFDLDIRRLCCLNLSRAYAMRIMAYEIHLTASNIHRSPNAIGERLPAGLKSILTKICDPAKLGSIRDNFVRNDFQPSTVRASETSAEVLLQTLGVINPSVLLRKIPRIGEGDDVSAGEAREYGDTFLYDFRLATNRVHSLMEDIDTKYDFDLQNVIITPEVQAVLDIKQYANQFLKNVLLVNHNSSIVDSQVILMRSFKTFVETASYHTPALMWPAKSMTPSSDALYTFLKDLLEKAQQETRDDGVTLTSYHILIEFIRNLTEKWISINGSVVAGEVSAQQKDYKHKTFEILFTLSGLLERENYALFNSICDHTAVRFHQPLLESVMLCLRTLSGINNAAPLSDDRMRFETCLTTILSVICSSFHVLVIKANSFSAEGSPVSEAVVENVVEDITVVVSLLQELISPKYKLAQDIWIEVFEKSNTVPSLISLFAGGIQVLVKEIDRQYSGAANGLNNIKITPYAETALYLLLSLSNIPKAADKLIKHNIFAVLCNNSLSPRLQQGQLDLFIRFGERNKNGPAHVERNPAHVCWGQILGVVNNLMRTIGNSETVLRDTVNFLQMYGPQIATAFNNANGANDSIFGLTASESLSSCLLEEVERINMIFFNLSKYSERLPNIANNLFIAFKDCSLFLLQRYHYFFTHPSHMQAQLHPVDNLERQQLQTFVAPDTNSEDSSSAAKSSSPTMIDTKPQISQLMIKILRLTMNITHYMLSTLIVLTNTDVILTMKNVEWPFGNTIISPGLRVTVGESASFGTLMECMNICTTIVNQWQGIAEFPAQMMLNVVQDCAILLTTQAALWVAKPGIPHESRLALAQENVPDIAETLNKTMTALNKLDGDKIENVVSKLKLMRLLQQYISQRYFEH